MKLNAAFAIVGVCIVSSIIILLLLTNGFGLISAIANRSFSASSQSELSTPTPANLSDFLAKVTSVSNQRDAERPPIYPNAQVLKQQPSQFYNQPDEISFFTDDSLETVQGFYSTVLDKVGWTEETPGRGSDYVNMFFTWHSSDPSLPYRLIMPVSILDGCWTDPYAQLGDNTSFVDKRCVHLVPMRKPYASRIPLYEDVSSVQTSDAPVLYRPSFISRTTEYKSTATSGEVAEFYKSRLQEYGWVLEAVLEHRASDSIEEGITFVDPTTPPNETEPPKAIISANLDKDGLTRVKIVAQGPELMDIQKP